MRAVGLLRAGLDDDLALKHAGRLVGDDVPVEFAALGRAARRERRTSVVSAWRRPSSRTRPPSAIFALSPSSRAKICRRTSAPPATNAKASSSALGAETRDLAFEMQARRRRRSRRHGRSARPREVDLRQGVALALGARADEASRRTGARAGAKRDGEARIDRRARRRRQAMDDFDARPACTPASIATAQAGVSAKASAKHRRRLAASAALRWRARAGDARGRRRRTVAATKRPSTSTSRDRPAALAREQAIARGLDRRGVGRARRAARRSPARTQDRCSARLRRAASAGPPPRSGGTAARGRRAARRASAANCSASVVSAAVLAMARCSGHAVLTRRPRRSRDSRCARAPAPARGRRS